MRSHGSPPLTTTEAWQLYDKLLADPRIGFLTERSTVEPRWKSLTHRRTPSPKLWMDAYLAAFAIETRHTLVTTDQAFTQFKDLKPMVLKLTC